MEGFDEVREGNERLMMWLESIIDILFMVSAKTQRKYRSSSIRALPSLVSGDRSGSFLSYLHRTEPVLYCYSLFFST